MKRDLWICTGSLLTVLLICFSAANYVVPSFTPIQLNDTPVLILDAGHGGEDGGAVSASGIKESDINLSVVLKLRSLMAFLGVNTVLTRDEDISIHDSNCTTLREKKVSDLKNRVELINSTPTAMIISVHQNTFTDPRYKGAQVFYGKGELSSQWGELTQNAVTLFLDHNNDRKATAVPDHVYLFSHIDCPAILFECGFLSNGEEASLLLTDSYQRKLAVTLTGAYFQQLQMIPSPLGGD